MFEEATAIKIPGEVPIIDPVNSPSHYTQGDIECIDAIKAQLSSEGFEGFCHGSAAKYLWRYRYKGKQAEDLNKANWYLNRLRKEVEED